MENKIQESTKSWESLNEPRFCDELSPELEDSWTEILNSISEAGLNFNSTMLDIWNDESLPQAYRDRAMILRLGRDLSFNSREALMEEYIKVRKYGELQNYGETDFQDYKQWVTSRPKDPNEELKNRLLNLSRGKTTSMLLAWGNINSNVSTFDQDIDPAKMLTWLSEIKNYEQEIGLTLVKHSSRLLILSDYFSDGVINQEEFEHHLNDLDISSGLPILMWDDDEDNKTRFPLLDDILTRYGKLENSQILKWAEEQKLIWVDHIINNNSCPNWLKTLKETQEYKLIEQIFYAVIQSGASLTDEFWENIKNFTNDKHYHLNMHQYLTLFKSTSSEYIKISALETLFTTLKVEHFVGRWRYLDKRVTHEMSVVESIINLANNPSINGKFLEIKAKVSEAHAKHYADQQERIAKSKQETAEREQVSKINRARKQVAADKLATILNSVKS